MELPEFKIGALVESLIEHPYEQIGIKDIGFVIKNYSHFPTMFLVFICGKQLQMFSDEIQKVL